MENDTFTHKYHEQSMVPIAFSGWSIWANYGLWEDCVKIKVYAGVNILSLIKDIVNIHI